MGILVRVMCLPVLAEVTMAVDMLVMGSWRLFIFRWSLHIQVFGVVLSKH
jgi:hypothetical protein